MVNKGHVLKLPRAEQWADRICSQVGKSVEAIIELGRVLHKAKADLVHGEWERMFDDGLVPFTHNTATRLMKIADHPLLSKGAHVHLLPPAWGTLYELTKVDSTRLSTALKDGTITPDISRSAIAALRPTSKRKTPRRRTERDLTATSTRWETAGDALYFQIARLLSDRFEDLAADEQHVLIDMLEQELTDLRRHLKPLEENPS